MKRQAIIIVSFILISVSIHAQIQNASSKCTTQYVQFKDAIVYLMNGDSIKVQANIFLKDASLFYLRNGLTIKADMNTIRSVKFGDDRYVRIDTILAKVLYSYKKNQLLGCNRIDLAAYQTQIKNTQSITNISISTTDFINVQRLDDNNINSDYPLMTKYYFLYNDSYTYANDRDFYKRIPKDKQSVYKRVTNDGTFSWYDASDLFKLLKFVSI